MFLILNDIMLIFSQLKKRNLHHSFINEDNLYLINGTVKVGGFEFFERTNKIKLTEREYLKFSQIEKNIDYLAPEILENKKLSMNMNLFSFGGLIYKLLYNSYPFEGKFDGNNDLILMYKNEVCSLDFVKIPEKKKKEKNLSKKQTISGPKMDSILENDHK
mgnify:CR=1 FL=1